MMFTLTRVDMRGETPKVFPFRIVFDSVGGARSAASKSLKQHGIEGELEWEVNEEYGRQEGHIVDLYFIIEFAQARG